MIVGSRDPNPLVHGKGCAFLREKGIEVIEDFMKEECDELNPIFFHYITKKKPYVALKYAMTADGKIATKNGLSKWISGEKSREYVHYLRHRYSAILCGISTVLNDNPMLNCRLKDEKGNFYGKNPLRIVCDSNLKIPLESQLVKSAKELPLIVACLKGNNSDDFEKKRALLEEKGVEIMEVSEGKNGGIDLKELCERLGQKKIDSILIEGGNQINYSALESGIVQKVYAFIAPKIFGGQAKSPVTGLGVEEPASAFEFKLLRTQIFDDDILIEYVKK